MSSEGNYDEELYKEAMAKVLQRLGKAKWILDATLGQKAMRIKFTMKGATDMLILKHLFEQIEWPKNAYEVLALIELANLAKTSSRASWQAEEGDGGKASPE